VNFITLKYRSAESLIPLLQPVLDEGVAVSGRGSTLIVNSAPEALEEIRALVSGLDTPLHTLRISVVQGSGDRSSRLHGDISGTPERPRIRLHGKGIKERETLSQQLTVLEGQWATIRAGESVPVVKRSTRHSHNGKSVEQSLEYQDVESGFEVRPRISGDTVTLEIRPFRARRSSHGAAVIQRQEISTTVSGSVGEWIELGSLSDVGEEDSIGTIYADDSKRSATHNVKIKVDRLNQ
jgi:type II secretory pathway component GspD/PulD (secretin)